ncbi:septum formation initiator [Secundilactobacillus oryzae JCM 18671]|uniref:Septum formation initiator n=1 Tax=Secundilactobacillus oryzae JCM 18671 TaxID=1291743 RepID=A0A081BH20_9LACO|nr:septum formation initiator family protein [Secundilactobacillus oryzae]GAK47338.1 septum formation initiator [Secundilactobacillus oryzae JCM 18671]
MMKEQKVRHLENDYIRRFRETTATVAGGGQHMSKRRKKRAMIILGVFFFFVLVFSIQIIYSKINLNSVQTELVTSKKELAKQKKTNVDLKEEVKLLHNKDYMEKLIRSKYLYTKTGETVYSFPNDH